MFYPPSARRRLGGSLMPVEPSGPPTGKGHELARREPAGAVEKGAGEARQLFQLTETTHRHLGLDARSALRVLRPVRCQELWEIYEVGSIALTWTFFEATSAATLRTSMFAPARADE